MLFYVFEVKCVQEILLKNVSVIYKSVTIKTNVNNNAPDEIVISGVRRGFCLPPTFSIYIYETAKLWA
jgi:hypothetical protein